MGDKIDLGATQRELDTRIEKRDGLNELRDAIDARVDAENERIEGMEQEFFVASKVRSPDEICDLDAETGMGSLRELEERAGERVPTQLVRTAVNQNEMDSSDVDEIVEHSQTYLSSEPARTVPDEPPDAKE
jgi:1,6-anhydro-N-acetylmuramate kinase